MWGFSLVAAGATLAAWLLASIVGARFLDLRPHLLQLALTVALYPPIAWASRRAHRTLEEWR